MKCLDLKDAQSPVQLSATDTLNYYISPCFWRLNLHIMDRLVNRRHHKMEVKIMKIIRVILIVLTAVLFPVFSCQATGQYMAPEYVQDWRTDLDPNPVAYSGQIPAKTYPGKNLPPEQRPPKEIPPKITVTGPSATSTEQVCANYRISINFSYVGEIGGSVNIKLDDHTIATGVPVQGGQGHYNWTALDSYSGKASKIYTVFVEAGNGAARGVGGKVEVIGEQMRGVCGK